MGIFSSIELADIYFKGSPSDFVWKSEYEDFPNASKLTVSESQIALFYFNGTCVGQLGAGIHILETENIPFLRNLLQKVSNNRSLFHAQIYFVNTTELSIKWGTSDITYRDVRGPVFTFGCSGVMNLVAEQPRKIVEKLVGVRVGTELVGVKNGEQILNQSLLTEKDVQDKFRDLIRADINDLLLQVMQEDKVSIVEIYSSLRKISDGLTPKLFELFDEYGFRLEKFRISNVAMPEEDEQYQRLKALLANLGMQSNELELQRERELMAADIEARKEMMHADAQQYRRTTEGITSVQERQFEVLNKTASNEGANSGMASSMMQMGLGMGMMGKAAGVVKEFMPTFETLSEKEETSQKNPTEVLENLRAAKMALDEGLITQEEYDRKKSEFLKLL